MKSSRNDHETSSYTAIAQIELLKKFCDDMVNVFNDFIKLGKNVKHSTTGTISIRDNNSEGKMASSNIIALEKHTGLRARDKKDLDQIYEELNKLSQTQQTASEAIEIPLEFENLFGLNQAKQGQAIGLAKINARLSPGGSDAYFLDPEVYGNLNYRQRIIVSDLIFDRAQKHYESQESNKPPHEQYQTQTDLVEARRAIGILFNQCLKSANLGMSNANDFDPNPDFVNAMKEQQKLLNLLNDIIIERKQAEKIGQYTKPYDSLIQNCLNVLINKDIPINKKSEALAREITQMLGDAKLGNVKLSSAKRRMSLPSASKDKQTEARRHSAPETNNEDPFIIATKKIYEKHQINPAMTTKAPTQQAQHHATMFSVKNLGENKNVQHKMKRVLKRRKKPQPEAKADLPKPVKK